MTETEGRSRAARRGHGGRRKRPAREGVVSSQNHHPLELAATRKLRRRAGDRARLAWQNAIVDQIRRALAASGPT